MLILIGAFFALFPLKTLLIAEPHIAIMKIDGMILPGSSEFLKESLLQAENEGAELLVVEIDTPGGLLQSTQEMVQLILNAPLPVVVYVSPSGAMAASAGVFIVMSAHIAAMAPGTSMGAAHPVLSDGKNVEGDMRAKAENITVAMVKSLSEKRGRNAAWAESAVKQSSSVTEKEALAENVIDVIAGSLDELLDKISKRQFSSRGEKVILKDLDYRSLVRREYQISFRLQMLNVLSNPSVVALLWLGGTTGLSLLLYNPGLILPGVVGAICLILALQASQIIPINTGALLLLALGGLLIGAELVVPSFIFGISGVIATVLGAIYIVDTTSMPGIRVALSLVLPTAFVISTFLLIIVIGVARALRKPLATGMESMIGIEGKALEDFSEKGRIMVNGEIWTAHAKGVFLKTGDVVKIIKIGEDTMLEVERV